MPGIHDLDLEGASGPVSQGVAGPDASPVPPLDPQNIHLAVRDALALHQRGNLADAEYDAALALNASNPQALINRANALFKVGRYAESVATYDRVLALAPAAMQAWNSRGLPLQALGRHDEALASYRKAIAIDRNFAD